LVKKTLYQEEDLFKFRRLMKTAGTSYFGGHFPITKTTGLLPYANVVSFIRNPYDQVLSHYKHFKLCNDYKDSFENFAISNLSLNIQARYFKSGIPANLIGNIGITENYNASLDQINTSFGLSLKARHDNANKSKTKLTAAQKKIVDKYNHRDFELYEFAIKTFNERNKIAKAGKEWVLGGYEILDNNTISGVAYFPKNNRGVVVKISNSGKPLTRIKATDYRPKVLLALPSRMGYVGFTHKLPSEIDPKDISVTVNNSGQNLFPYAII